MANYKRMVSYMYQYENGMKKKNVGFARIEAKDGLCKITLHMQLLGQLDSIFPTYLIQREGSSTELVYVGDTVLKNQVMDSRLTAEEENIMDSGYSLNDMGGLLIFLNENVFFATEWEDRPISAEEVLGALKPKKQLKQKPREKAEIESEVKKEIQSEEKTEIEADEEMVKKTEEKAESRLTLEQEISIPKYKLPRGYKIVERLQKPENYYRKNGGDNLLKAADGVNEEVEMGDEALKAFTKEERKDLLQQVTEKRDTEQKQEQVFDEIEAPEQPQEKEDSKIAGNIFEKYPRIYPFEDNEILICVKIEPKDIGLLPKNLWTLSNNSFLVHGYYCYHHLVFAKLKDRFGSRYILGIPGIYHERERFMARMFGFECFKPIRKRELRQGDFGYWYIPVILNPAD